MTGYELAGCADRAQVLVSKGTFDGGMLAPDWDKFAVEVNKLLAAALAACARESEKPLLETLTRIRRTAARDQVMNDPSNLLEEVYRLSVAALEAKIGQHV